LVDAIGCHPMCHRNRGHVRSCLLPLTVQCLPMVHLGKCLWDHHRLTPALLPLTMCSPGTPTWATSAPRPSTWPSFSLVRALGRQGSDVFSVPSVSWWFLNLITGLYEGSMKPDTKTTERYWGSYVRKDKTRASSPAIHLS
jgi:hypothetical protein